MTHKAELAFTRRCEMVCKALCELSEMPDKTLADRQALTYEYGIMSGQLESIEKQATQTDSLTTHALAALVPALHVAYVPDIHVGDPPATLGSRIMQVLLEFTKTIAPQLQRDIQLRVIVEGIGKGNGIGKDPEARKMAAEVLRVLNQHATTLPQDKSR